MLPDRLADYLPEEAMREARRNESAITEIRIRASRPVQLVLGAEDMFVGPAISASRIHSMVVGLLEHSYYAREEELARGFFTLRSGCRVGVAGLFCEADGKISLQRIGSLCVRIAREFPGCADPIMNELSLRDRPESILIASPPGMGKTTLLRDCARQLSGAGWQVGIADERHEIAACVDGAPTMDIGLRSDVIDGLPKAQAMELLVRSMSPQIIVTDELGGAADVNAALEAARKGVALIASVHASGPADLFGGPAGVLLDSGVFSAIVFLGKPPGTIAGIRKTGEMKASWKSDWRSRAL